LVHQQWDKVVEFIEADIKWFTEAKLILQNCIDRHLAKDEKNSNYFRTK
jgi:hypothetical protein